MAQVADNDSRNSICLMAGSTVLYDFAGLARMFLMSDEPPFH